MTERTHPTTDPSGQPEPLSLLSLPPEQARAALTLAHGGTVTAAAAAAGVHRSSIYNWYEKDEFFQLAVNEIQRERTLRLADDMRRLESLALARLLRILEDDTVSPSVHLRAAMLVFNRSKNFLGVEQWRLPKMEDLAATRKASPGVATPPAFDIHRHISTEIAESPAAAPAPVDTARQNSTQPAPPDAPEALPVPLDTSRHFATRPAPSTRHSSTPIAAPGPVAATPPTGPRKAAAA